MTERQRNFFIALALLLAIILGRNLLDWIAYH